MVTPLTAGKALVLFALIYVGLVVGWANLSGSAASDARNYWPVFVIIGTPMGLIVLRMLSAILAQGWFVATLTIAFVAIAVAAVVMLPVEAAYAFVYRSPAFVLLGASAAVSLAASILLGPWKRSTRAYLILEAGALVALSGALVNVNGHATGAVTITKTRPVSALSMNDFVLTLVTADGRWSTVKLPVEDVSGKRALAGYRVMEKPVRLVAEYVPGEADVTPPQVRLTASTDSKLVTFTAPYEAGFVPIEMGDTKLRVAFGPTLLGLPFEMRLDYAGEEDIRPDAAPPAADASVTLKDIHSGQSVRKDLKLGVALKASGFRIRLRAVEKPTAATIAITRDPGTGIFAAGVGICALAVAVAARRRMARRG